MAGGALLVQGSIPAMKHSDRQEAAFEHPHDGLLDGVCDIHLHCRPDSHHTPGIAWSGDILMLYALLGMLLPLFRRTSDKRLLSWAGLFLFLPIAVDFVCEMTRTNLALPFIRLQETYCDK